eukprot:COSAG06_NODE_7947_length_2325_cov_18.452830_5_plen_69_part_01
MKVKTGAGTCYDSGNIIKNAPILDTVGLLAMGHDPDGIIARISWLTGRGQQSDSYIAGSNHAMTLARMH